MRVSGGDWSRMLVSGRGPYEGLTMDRVISEKQKGKAPPPDALDEFKVVTNNMSAEFGRSGGATVNVAYRSGSNRFSASAWVSSVAAPVAASTSVTTPSRR